MEKRMEVRLFDLENRVKSQDQEILELKTELSELKLKMRTMEEVGLNSLKKIIRRRKYVDKASSITSMVNSISTEETVGHTYARSQRIQVTDIAFYALLSSNVVDGSLKQQPLVFDLVKTQIGTGYNNLNGMFTAPMNGIYIYSTSITMGHHTIATFQILKNADVIGVSEFSNETDRYASTTVIVELGDVVFVRRGNTSTPYHTVISDNMGRSSFAGWRL